MNQLKENKSINKDKLTEQMLSDLSSLMETAWYNSDSQENIRKTAYNFVQRVIITIEDIIKNYTPNEKVQSEKEVCICSAVKTANGQIIRGHRHDDCLTTIRNMGFRPSTASEAQGFITSENRFVTREEGRKLQDEAGVPSVDKDGYRGSTLFSEDLY